MAVAWDNLGFAQHHIGRHEQAITCYQRAADLFEATGAHYDQADTLTRLGDTHSDTGDHDAARVAWQRSLSVFQQLRSPAAAVVRDRIEQLGTQL